MASQNDALFLDADRSRLTVEQRSGTAPEISGLAAVYYDGDRGTEYRLGPDVVERIAPGAFDGVLADDVRAVFNHDPSAVLGRAGGPTPTLNLASTGRGLSYRIRPPDTAIGRDVVELIRRGDVDGSSFRFAVDRDGVDLDRDDDTGGTVRTIRQVAKLIDVGPVTFPAYDATTTAMRAAVYESIAYRSGVRDRRRRVRARAGMFYLLNRGVDAAAASG